MKMNFRATKDLISYEEYNDYPLSSFVINPCINTNDYILNLEENRRIRLPHPWYQFIVTTFSDDGKLVQINAFIRPVWNDEKNCFEDIIEGEAKDGYQIASIQFSKPVPKGLQGKTFKERIKFVWCDKEGNLCPRESNIYNASLDLCYRIRSIGFSEETKHIQEDISSFIRRAFIEKRVVFPAFGYSAKQGHHIFTIIENENKVVKKIIWMGVGEVQQLIFDHIEEGKSITLRRIHDAYEIIETPSEPEQINKFKIYRPEEKEILDDLFTAFENIFVRNKAKLPSVHDEIIDGEYYGLFAQRPLS